MFSKDAVSNLANGRIGILPTDTIYGLVCDASNQTAVERLYAIKKRVNKPGTIVAADINQLVELGFKARYLKAVQNFWPGPISIEIPCVELSYLHIGNGKVAVRIPSDEKFVEFLKKTGPLLTTSANPPNQPTANNIREARKYFGKNVDFYEDGGDLSNHSSSTIIRIVDDAIEIVRQGAVKIDESGKIL